MKLKDAVVLAASYAGTEPPFDDIKIVDGGVSAWDRHRGVVVSCSEIEGLTVSAPAAQLVKAVKALRKPKITKGKRTLKVADGSSAFTVKYTGSVSSCPVQVPKGGWVPLDVATVQAVQAVAKIVGREVPGHPLLGGLHFAAQWIGGANHQGAWVVWPKAGTGRVITVDADIVDKAEGAINLHIDERYLHLQDQTEQVRWAVGMAGEYPEGAVDQLIAGARERTGRVIVKINVKSLTDLLRTAVHAQTSPADVFELEIENQDVVVRRPHDDAAGFEGFAVMESVQAGKACTGVDPSMLLKTLALCVEDQASYYLMLGLPTDLVVVWGGDEVVIEAAMAAMYLPSKGAT